MPNNSYQREVTMQRTMPWLFVAATLAVLCGSLLACHSYIYGSDHQDKKEGIHRDQKITNSSGITVVLIPAGEFLMGAPDADDLAQKDEKPQHAVRIGQPFYLGAHEVTVAQFRTF